MERADRTPVATFFTTEPLAPRVVVTLPEEAAHHIRVTRVGVGECVALRNGTGGAAVGTLVKLSRAAAVVEIDSVREIRRPQPIHLLAPVADRERMLWLAEKATELGVASWRPVMWRRSRSVSPRGEGPTFQTKLRARMASALVQSGGGWLPDVFPESTIAHAIAATPSGTRLLLHPDGDPITPDAMSAPITIALGPEGGMEAGERDSFLDADFQLVKLAENTLRFETAGVAAVAIAAASLALTRQSNG